MLADLLRFLICLFDVRAWARLLMRQPLVDVVFISNLRSEDDRKRYFGRLVPERGHADGARIYQNGVAGRMRFIYSTAQEMTSEYGKRRAREQVIDACGWAERKGARVVLLSGATAGLFGKEASVLRERFPGLLFTCGINATAHLQWEDVQRALSATRLDNARSRVMVVGPYGPLGFYLARRLIKLGCHVLGYGANREALHAVADRLEIETVEHLSDTCEVDAVVSCMPSAALEFNEGRHGHLRRIGRKLLLVDLAAPPTVDAKTVNRLRNSIVHQGSSNAHARSLHYVLGPVTRRMMGLAPGVMYSCFAEAMSLYYVIEQLDRKELAELDWLKLDDKCVAHIAAAFTVTGIELGEAHSFGHAVGKFDLEYESELPTVIELPPGSFPLEPAMH
jgi:predicted amino acid dehydrogenase